MDMMRELTDCELESVTGGTAAAVAVAGALFGAAMAASTSLDFQAVLPFGSSVTVAFSTTEAFGFAV